MSGDRPSLDKLTESIGDGDPVDWDKICSLEGDEDIRQLVEQLRIVAAVASVHRSQLDETVPGSLSGPPVGSALSPTTHKRWGHLLLLRKIGEGAFGEVYEALDTWLDHRRALKLLKPERLGGPSAANILHEARKLVRVRHPNVVMVHGADRHDGRVGFWMDLIEGDTLEQRVGKGRMSAGEATYIGQELCRALAAVHLADLLHRDIKAQNVMRSSDGGRIILMDFGAGEFRSVAAAGRGAGTPLYLAPELFAGSAASIQTDIYALGVLLYYLVTSQFPVEGDSFEALMRAHARGDRRPLRDARPDLPDSFVTVVERALDPSPQRRFRSAGDFHTALEHPEWPPHRIPPVQADARDSHRDGSDQAALTYTLTGAIAVAALAIVCGLVACRTFEVALRVDPFFGPTLADYVAHGTKGLIPFGLNWLAGIALVALFTGAHALGSRVRLGLDALEQRITALRPVSLAMLIPFTVAIGWLALTWWHWAVFEALWSLQNGTVTPNRSGVLLDPSLYTSHKFYSQICAVLTFVLVFGVWRWWPWLEQHAEDPITVRRMKWVSVALCLAIIVASIAPRRVFWDYFEVVLYKNEESLVIGSRDGEVLLLPVARPAGTLRPRARRDNPEVVATGKQRSLVGRE